ncbi:MAG: SufS family cysteine desulfurase [Lachnospiraceae bacterium]|nr:SufS family cysteine desulfurase [Lachnospiraceae bacterium]
MPENRFKKDFPIFDNKPCAYLDSAATAQRPEKVIEAERSFYANMNANPLRGLYELSMEATEAYEASRIAVRDLVNAGDEAEIIFTRNASESLNLVAYSYGMNFICEGDEIVTTVMEHHSNMLPWQMVAERTGAKLIYLEPEKDGSFSEDELGRKITDRCKLIAIAQVSNVLGCVNPVKRLAERVHANGGIIVVDGAQSVPHMKVDVRELGIDFLAFSGHKLMAPFGIGVLYGKRELLEKMPPFMTGGEMIEYVHLDGATWAELPHKFEAGTVNAAGAYGLKAAIEYLTEVGYDTVREIEDRLTARIFDEFAKLPYIHIYGSPDPAKHTGIVAFTVDGVHPHDIASILDADKVDIRAGHHCAQPLMDYLGVGNTARASLYLYNDESDVDRFIESIVKVRKIMGYGDG